MIHKETINHIRTKWTRQQTKMANMIQKMETELANLKKKNIHESVIQSRESYINQIIESMNTADDLINLLIVNQNSMALENAIMDKQITRWLRDEGKLAEFASEANTMEMVKDFVTEYKRAQQG